MDWSSVAFRMMRSRSRRHVRCDRLGKYSFAVAQAAAIAVRISAGRDFDPVLRMMAARWLSTVRWLMPRSAAMFLLGWPARTRSRIWR